MHARHLWIPLLGFPLLAFIFCACQSSYRDDVHTFYVGLASPPTTLDPRRATDAYSQRIADLLFSALVRTGPDLNPVPEASASWKIEKKKITFTLRDDLKFSNGRPVDSSDVVFSIGEFKNPVTPFATSLSAIESVENPDSKTVVLNLKEDDASLLSNLNVVKILPKESMGRLSEQPVGSGPFNFVSLDNNQLVLKRTDFPSYCHPAIEKIEFKFVRDDNTRYLKMIKGDLDALLNELQEEKVSDLKKSRQVDVLVTPGLNFNFLVVNFKDERLKNPRFRKALFSAIDRDDIVKYKLENLATVAASVIAPASPFSNPNIKLPGMTLSDARAAVKDLHLDGTEITLLTSDQGLANAQVIAEQLEQLGVKIRLKSYEWGTFYNDLKNGNFQLATSRWVGIVDPDVYRDTLDSHEFPPTGRNRGFYVNKAFDSLVEKARDEINFDKRKKLYYQAEQMAADDLAVFPLWYNANISVLGKRVQNFTPMITGSFFPFTEASKK